MFTTESVRDLYHAYFYDAQKVGLEPMSFVEWYDQVFRPFLAGRKLILNPN